MVPRANLLIKAFSIAFLFYCCQMTFGKDVHNFQAAELDEADRAKLCHNFSVGNRDKRELYSPNYPNNYPNNTECIVTLTAPFGYFISLDFRDRFEMEDSPTCEYDGLEIRYGAHGYSTPVEKYCGHKFPKTINSPERYLWLKFYSDDSIEYGGFRAVYQFIPIANFTRPPPSDCSFKRIVKDGGGIIEHDEISESIFNYSLTWNYPLDCSWIIQVDPGWKIYLNFKQYELREPNKCDVNFIEIYQEELTDETRLARFCGTVTEPQRSKGNLVHVRYFSQPEALSATFLLIYTAFRESDNCDKRTEFDCEDGWCIHKDLKCDGYYNCKYRYDEDPSLCRPGSTASVVLTSEHMIIILIVFFALVLGMCASITISCYSKIKEQRQRDREYRMRRSKEASIEGVDRSLSSLEHGITEAALAVQAAEIGARRKRKPDEEDENGCYVPEVDLSVFRKHPNGGHSIPVIEDDKISPTEGRRRGSPDEHKHHHHPYCSEHRDSLRSDSLSPPIPPPPPPPAPPHLRNRERQTKADPSMGDNHHSHQCVQNTRTDNFRSYQPTTAPEDEDDRRVPSQHPQGHRFRAEAVIEIGHTGSGVGTPSSRPRSFDSTRSAPDVVVHR